MYQLDDVLGENKIQGREFFYSLRTKLNRHSLIKPFKLFYTSHKDKQRYQKDVKDLESAVISHCGSELFIESCDELFRKFTIPLLYANLGM